MGEVHWRQEAVALAREAFERALALFEPNDSPEVAETILRLADLHVTSLGQPTVGMAYAERALALVERLDDRRLEAAACCVAGNVRIRSNDAPGGLPLLERALALAQAHDDPVVAAEACAYLANVFAWNGDVDRSYAVSLLRAQLAERTHDPFALRHVYSWLGGMETLRGRWPEAEAMFARQGRVLEGLEGPEPHAILRAFRGLQHYYQGQFEEAALVYQGAVDLVRPTGSGTLLWYLGGLGLTLIELGRRDEALRCFAELHALAGPLDERTSATLGAFAYLAVGYARLGEREQAAACYPALLPFRGQFAPIPVDRALGLAAAAHGDVITARRHLADAEAQARRAGLRPELALILLERGDVQRKCRPDRSLPPEAAADPLADGLQLCADLGMEQLGQQILHPVLARQERAPSQSASIAGLSDREIDVLRLVAHGQTNREIAGTLFLSEYTVARHLTHIFTKTGVENRAGAAAWALRHGLA
jgi:DNA-binding CsgD family transcriptional regulator/tetratricopeptide (TPR) repeat protein